MSIYENKAKGGWRVQVDIGTLPDGRRDRKTVSCKTKREAQRAELDLLMLKRDLRGHSNRITLGEYIDGYFWPDKEGILRKNTLVGYDRDIRLRIRPRFGNRLIADITHAEIQRMLSACPTRSTADNARDTLRCILSHAKDNEVLVHNPAAGRFKLPESISAIKEDTPWVTSFAEHLRIIEAADDPQVERLLVLGLCFGLRKGEVLGLDWEHIDIKKRVIRVTQTYTVAGRELCLTPPKTEASRREIPITDVAMRYLGEWRDRDRDARKVEHITGRAHPVCVHRARRMTPNRARDVLARFFKGAPELPRVTCSTMRHSFATAAILGGINVATVSKWLGHTDVTTTINRYVRPLQTDLAKDAKRISLLYSA
jgi:integrase